MSSLHLPPLSKLVLDLDLLLKRFSLLKQDNQKICHVLQKENGIVELRRELFALGNWDNLWHDMISANQPGTTLNKTQLCQMVTRRLQFLVAKRFVQRVGGATPKSFRAGLAYLLSVYQKFRGFKVQTRSKRKDTLEGPSQDFFRLIINQDAQEKLRLEQDRYGVIYNTQSVAGVKQDRFLPFPGVAPTCAAATREDRRQVFHNLNNFRAFIINQNPDHALAIWFFRPNGEVRTNLQEICFAINQYRRNGTQQHADIPETIPLEGLLPKKEIDENEEAEIQGTHAEFFTRNTRRPKQPPTDITTRQPTVLDITDLA